MEVSINDLVNLEDHCFLCFRNVHAPSNKERKVGEPDNADKPFREGNETEKLNVAGIREETLCKKFLKLLTRHLRIPVAELTIICDEDDPPTPKKVCKRWEDLITGQICEACKELVEPFCNLYFQMDFIKMQMQVKMQELEESIHFTDQDVSCRAARDTLRAKWVMDGKEIEHRFSLLDVLRKNILDKAVNKKKNPVVSTERIPDRDPHYVATTTIKEHRQSVEDSGVSINSGLSPVSSLYEEKETRSKGRPASRENTSAKEYKVIRKVFRCRMCTEKFFTREKLETHKVVHPKANKSNIDKPITSPVPSVGNPSKVFKIRRTAFICQTSNCGAKFLTHEKLMEHMTASHSNSVIISTDRAGIPEAVKSLSGSNELGHIKKVDPIIQDIASATQTEFESEHLQMDSSMNTSPLKQVRKRSPYMKRNFKCQYRGCLKKFHTAEELVLHAQFHRRHPCSFCKIICKDPSVLASHEFQHTNQVRRPRNKITCPRCPDSSIVFDHFSRYRKHFYANHLGVKAPISKCSKCNISVISKNMTTHSARCRGRLTIGAESNPDSSIASSSMGKRISTNNIEESEAPFSSKYICNLCSLRCNSFTALQSHVIASHDPNILFCNDCERMFHSPESFDRHRAYFHLKLKVCVKYCKHCNAQKTFKSLSQFNVHVQQHEVHQQKQQQGISKKRNCLEECPTCKRRVRNLPLHMYTHAREKLQPNDSTDDCPQPDEADLSINGTIRSNDQEQSVPANEEILDQEDESPADRIKLRRQRSSSSRMEQSLDDVAAEEIDETTKKQGEKRGRKPKIVETTDEIVDSNPLNEETDNDSNQPQTKRMKAVESEIQTENNENEKAIDNESPEDQRPSQLSLKIESLSPAKKDQQPQLPLSPEARDDESCQSGETVIVERTSNNSSSNIPSNTQAIETNDKNSEKEVVVPSEMVKQEVDGNDEPVTPVLHPINARFRKWMEMNVKRKALESNIDTTTEPLASSSNPSNHGDGNKEKGSECVDLSEDEQDSEEIEKKPEINNIFLSERVRTWLSDRQSIQQLTPPTPMEDSSNVEIITLD